MLRRFAALALLLALPSALLVADDKPQFAGPTDKGFLLPNGWLLTPAGKHVVLTDLPLNILPLSDNKHALVACSGFNQHDLSLVDLTDLKVVASQPARQSWFGLVVNPKEDRVWWAVGGGVTLRHVFNYDQVFGDIKKGNGDPSLVLFGEQVTPNHHDLVEEFVLLDNLYCNGQVSRDGHPWSRRVAAIGEATASHWRNRLV